MGEGGTYEGWVEGGEGGEHFGLVISDVGGCAWWFGGSKRGKWSRWPVEALKSRSVRLGVYFRNVGLIPRCT